MSEPFDLQLTLPITRIELADLCLQLRMTAYENRKSAFGIQTITPMQYNMAYEYYKFEINQGILGRYGI